MMLFMGITMPLMGGALLIGAVFAAFYQRRKFAGRQPAEGQVIELVREMFNPGSPGIYCPVVRFAAPSGEEIEFKSEHGSRPSMYKVGQKVTVLYDPANPEQAEIRSKVGRWLVPAVMTFIGLGLMCGGCFALVFYFVMANASV
ncbi:DUF3592 domain-containing protein [Chloroflexota bacterium]